jgi:hypothetical protein
LLLIPLDETIIFMSAEQWAQCFMEMNKIVPLKYHP